MKKTAVEWLVEQMMYQMEIRIENTTIGCDLFEQAKEMEKQQIIDAFEKGYENGACVSDEESIYHGGNYYNKTFKSE